MTKLFLPISILNAGLLSFSCRDGGNPTKQEDNPPVTQSNDYFPLKVGNKWFFTGEAGYYDAHPTAISYTGRKTWEVVAGMEFADRNEYSMREVFTGTEINNWSEEAFPADPKYHHDTTSFTLQSKFTLIQGANDTVVVRNDSGFAYQPYAVSLVSFKRHNERQLVGDTLIIPIYTSSTGSGPGHQWLSRGKGLLDYEYTDYHAWSGVYMNARLDSAKLY